MGRFASRRASTLATLAATGPGSSHARLRPRRSVLGTGQHASSKIPSPRAHSHGGLGGGGGNGFGSYDVRVPSDPSGRRPQQQPVTRSFRRRQDGRGSSRGNYQPPQVYSTSAPTRPGWEEFTEKLVDAASIPFIFLLVPQVWKNLQNLLAGNPQALAILSTEGYFVSFLGNLMLMSYFVSRGESGAVVIQALGVVSNFAMLTQIFLAGFLPTSLFQGILGITILSLAINSAKLARLMESDRLAETWGLWQRALGVVGLAVLPQVLWQTFTASRSVVPGLVALAGGLLLNLDSRLVSIPAPLLRLRDMLGACTATLLFMLQPVAQLAVNFSNPSSLEGISLATCCLAMVGNAMMVPRALYTQDLVWFAGCSWGYMLMGWGQLLSLFIGIDGNGTRFLHPLAFAASTLFAFGYFVFVVIQNTRCLGLKSPLASFARLQWPQLPKSSVERKPIN